MNDVWQTIAEEFSDLPSLAEVVRVSIRLVMAAVPGRGARVRPGDAAVTRPGCGRTC